VQAKRCWFFRNGFDCYKRNGATSPCYAVLGDHRFQHAAVDGHRCQAVTPSDLATVLLALDADVEITGPHPRTVPIAEFYTGPGETVLREGELVTAVTVPEHALRRATAFAKLARYTGDFATASAAITVDVGADRTWRDVRLVLGALAPAPLRMREAEAALTGSAPDPRTVARAVDAELERIAHPLPGNAWKLDAAVGLVEQACERLEHSTRA
jgi:CO/xanthine dehydrogenase FAD-binding subunit